MYMNFCNNWSCTRQETGEIVPVTLPHDAMLSEKMLSNSKGAHNIGWYRGGDYIYEKKFTVPDLYQNQFVYFEFEGVYKDAEVWINDQYAGSNAYGYTGFLIYANSFLQEGENTIRVSVQNSDQPNSRWYTGTGIYRPVSLHILPEAHLLPYGVKIRTSNWTKKEIELSVQTSQTGHLKFEILDESKPIWTQEATTDGTFQLQIQLNDIELWSPQHPKLYQLRVTFGEDIQEETFGVRGLFTDSKTGLCINGQRVILRGACIHHDNGILGACAYAEAESRKIRLLKAAGYNAIRSAHNPCSKAMLEACDREGILVMDEYVDMWYIHKTKYDYALHMENNYKKDLKAMVDKDYNHPSVIMYCTGNEVAETGQPHGIELCGKMTDYLHTLDPDRPVTCGINLFFNFLHSLGFGVYTDEKADTNSNPAVGSAFYNKLAMLFGAPFMKFGATLHGSDVKTRDSFSRMDIAGYNYGIWRHRKDVKKYPNRVIVGTETFCADAYRFWEDAKKYPAVIGDFVWAGMDYLGEVAGDVWNSDEYAPTQTPGPGWTGAGGGRVNMVGTETAEAAYTKVAFELAPIGMGVIPAHRAKDAYIAPAWNLTNAVRSWSWNGCEGNKTWVEVYARAHTVELLINGKKVGRKRIHSGCRVVFPVTYEPGEVKAISYDKNHKKLAEISMCSAVDSTKLTLLPEKSNGRLTFIKLQYTDENGIVKPLERGVITVTVRGGKLLGLGSAAPYTKFSYLSNKTDTYYGEALAVIQSDSKTPLTVIAESPYGRESLILN